MADLPGGLISSALPNVQYSYEDNNLLKHILFTLRAQPVTACFERSAAYGTERRLYLPLLRQRMQGLVKSMVSWETPHRRHSQVTPPFIIVPEVPGARLSFGEANRTLSRSVMIACRNANAAIFDLQLAGREVFTPPRLVAAQLGIRPQVQYECLRDHGIEVSLGLAACRIEAGDQSLTVPRVR